MALIDDIKLSLGITTNDEDVNRNIDLKIKAVQNYLITGGATDETINSDSGMACITIGVNDLLNEKAGEVNFSPAFKTLANQVCRG